MAGGGWAGLAAAVRAVQAGWHVVLFETAPQLGGRARGLFVDGLALDNGQHILIGAYARTLALMRTVGVEVDEVLARRPLELRYPDGRGLAMPAAAGPAWLGFALAVARARGWSVGERARFGVAAARWAMDGFACDARLTVAELCADLPAPVRALLIEPLCVAALNTPTAEASAAVLLRVLRDALFGGRGAADLLLPCRPLTQLLPGPAAAWLAARGADLRLGRRVQRLAPRSAGAGWRVDDERFDAVVLACPPWEAARLAAEVNPGWAATAAALEYEPIVTVYLRSPGAHLAAPMMALQDGPDAPAQFAFDHGALGAAQGQFAFVVSGARRWVERGLDATVAAVVAQAHAAFGAAAWPGGLEVLRTLAEKRATFRCTPGLLRPGSVIAPSLVAAGDYVDGPYPATLEGAVRAGEAAVRRLAD